MFHLTRYSLTLRRRKGLLRKVNLIIKGRLLIHKMRLFLHILGTVNVTDRLLQVQLVELTLILLLLLGSRQTVNKD